MTASGAGTDARGAPRPAGSPEVSFVVIAYNEARHVRATVDSILAQEDLEAFEVVVVDDGSTDATADVVEAIARDRPEVRLVRHDANRGRGAARASGVAAADGRWIAMVDADILLPARWWRTCREKLADHDAVGGTAVPDGDVAYVHRRYRLEPKVRGATTIVTGNNGAYLGEAIRTVTFDAALSEGEDVAINHALRSAGYRLTGIEGLVVEHQESKGFAASLRWLFVSGVGATRQLWRYRQVRPPDVAFAGFALVPVVTRRRPGLAIASVLAYALLAAAAHLAGRFRLDPRRPAALLAAVATDSLLLLAYFAGRAFGVVVLVRPRGAPAGRAGEP